MTTPDYSGMSWDDLMQLRRSMASDDPRQAEVAPYEHQAYARETVAQNPLYAASLGVAIPAYTLAKLAGLTGARSPASMQEMQSGYRGIGQGLLKYLRGAQ